MKKTKLVSLILGLSLLGSVISGCSSSKTVSNEGGAKDKVVNLTYGVWDKNQEASMKQIAVAFEKSHPNIKVKVEITPFKQYWTKLETEATGGNLPDVFWMNGPHIAQYVGGKMLMPIGEKFKKDNFDTSVFPESLINLYTIKDEKYGMPKDWDTTALWFNKKIFDDAKIPYPDNTWDWNKLREVAKTLTNKSKGIYGIAAPQNDQEGYYNTTLQSGGFAISEDRKVSGYDKPETIEGIQCWLDLIKDGSSPTAQQMGDTQPANLFESGKVAMVYQGSWMLSEFAKNEYTKDKVDLVVMPKMKKRAAVIHGLGNVIYAKTKNPDAAWEFVKYLGGKEANDIQASAGVAIPAYKPAIQAFLDATKQFNGKAYVDELEYSVMYPSSKETAKWNALEMDNLKMAWAGQVTAEVACKKIAEEMNKILAEENK
ncbi:sugar ABC transporter substrate-binding protein [Clostridium sp. CF012]|uniref:ABC transporter substrate-binding protein n=1 Tax=Clostridium sp. CF012 TaxID=2843319 RepID=UPI001C0D5F54|nr:sugar ABC transporter substrate-binding protein [Clostridium sp. CF012]MBU3144356.1 sugar ABC transporter substrate-binding protein [Clostridium sp. CF012]